MNDPESPFDPHAHPVGPEVDGSVNPTEPSDDIRTDSPEAGSDTNSGPTNDETGQKPRPTAGREMLIQLQQMIDTVALQAAPVMREVGAKAAELAAVAAEKAGPAAHKAAEVTESVGGRIAARSKEMAADLRRPRTDDGTEAAAESSADVSGPADPAQSGESDTSSSDPAGSNEPGQSGEPY